MTRTRLGCTIWLVLLLSTVAVPVRAAGHGPTDPSEVEAFLDATIPPQLAAYHIPGATVAVVRDGRLLVAKGYGYANAATRQPVDAETTLFHVGSITKLFTWTAIMQLVEQGRLDLHADVNRYLPPAAQLPPTYAEPVRLENLLTHTGGFADSLYHIHRLSADDGVPLSRYVVERMPARLYPPGQTIAYSNYAAGLAGYIIEQVTGVPYETYVEDHILTPLGMRHTFIRRPLPPAVQGDEAMGHIWLVRRLYPVQEYIASAPMAGLASTATDMAAFMIAHLQEGRYGDVRILQPETARAMHSQQFTQDTRITGVTYGFVLWQRNGQRILWHEGSTAFFQGLLMLLPDDGVGVFISYNRKGHNGARREFRQRFLDHYYPTPRAVPQPMPGYRERARRFAGYYHESRWPSRTSDALFYLFGRTHRIRANADGTLSLLGMTYVEVAPGLFRQVDGQGTLVFREDERGRVVRAAYDFDPHEVLIRMAWYETPPFHLAVAAGFAVVFIAAATLSPRRTSAAPSLAASEGPTLFHWVGRICLAYPPAMFATWLTTQVWALPNLAFLTPFLDAALLLPLPPAVATVTAAWRHGYWTRTTRWGYTLVTAIALAYLVWLHHWNLLGLWRW